MRGISNRSLTLLQLTMLLGVSVFASTSNAADMVPWVDDLQTAQQMASARNQLILIHFYSNNCPPCRRLESNVFSRPGFGHGVARNYVPVRINASVSPDLARRFKVEQWPTDLMITSQGEEVHRMVSPQDVNEYLRILNQVAWRINSMPVGTPVHSVSQGFVNDANPRSSTVGTDSPFQFAAKTPQTPMPVGAKEQQRTVPRYDLGGQVAQANAIVESPSNFTGTGGATPSQSLVSNQFAANVQPNSGQLTPQQSIAQAEQQIAAAQKQLAAVQQKATQPQFIENKFAASPAHQPLSNVFVAQPNAALAMPAPQQADSAQTLEQPNQFAQISPPAQGDSTGPALSSPSQFGSSQFGSPGPNMNMAPPQAAVPQQMPQLPVTETKPIGELGLEGYCPVSLIDEDRWVKGDKRWGARHRGRLYLFQTAAAQQKFLANPDQFSPVLAGFDPVEFAEQGQYTEGMRTHGIRYKDQIYLFVSEESLARFAQSPGRYAEVAHRAIGGGRQMR